MSVNVTVTSALPTVFSGHVKLPETVPVRFVPATFVPVVFPVRVKFLDGIESVSEYRAEEETVPPTVLWQTHLALNEQVVPFLLAVPDTTERVIRLHIAYSVVEMPEYVTPGL